MLPSAPAALAAPELCGTVDVGAATLPATLTAVEVATSMLTTVAVGADGAFCVRVPAGTYAFTAAHAEGAAYAAPAVFSGPGAGIVLAPLVVGPALSAVVSDDTGAPVRGAQVAFKRDSPPSGQWFVATTDAAGRAVVAAPAGRYTVMVVQPGWLHAPGYLGDQQREARITAVAADRASAMPAPRLENLRAAAAELDDAGIARLTDRLATARIIGLGEANHGSRESQLVRNRVIETLMERGLIDMIALEANFTESLDLDRYVAGEALDGRDAVRRLGFWMWRNQEFLDLVELVRVHNTRPGARRVRMLGVDMQEPRESTARLLAGLRPVLGRKRHAEAVSTLAPFAAADTYAAFRALAPAKQREVEALLRSLVGRIPRRASVELHWNGRVALQAAALFQHRDASEFSDVRDALLGENAERALHDFGRGGRQVILGHNSHVAGAPFRAGPSMGTVLRRLLGPAYATVGVVVDSGAVTARPAGGDLATVPIAPVDSPLQRVLRSVSPNDFVLDLAPLVANDSAWWTVPWPTREFGAIYRSGDSLRSRRLPEHFDFVVFLHAVSPTVVFPK